MKSLLRALSLDLGFYCLWSFLLSIFSGAPLLLILWFTKNLPQQLFTNLTVWFNMSRKGQRKRFWLEAYTLTRFIILYSIILAVYAVRLKEALHYVRKPPLIMTLIELLCCLHTVSQLAKKRRYTHDCPALLSATVLLQHCAKALSITQFLYVFLGKWETNVAIYWNVCKYK